MFFYWSIYSRKFLQFLYYFTNKDSPLAWRFQSAWLNKLACGAPLHVHGYQRNKRPVEVASMLAHRRWLGSNNGASTGAWPLVSTAWTRVHALAVVVLHFHGCWCGKAHWCHSGAAHMSAGIPMSSRTSANLAPPQTAFHIAETSQPTPFTFLVLLMAVLLLPAHWINHQSQISEQMQQAQCYINQQQICWTNLTCKVAVTLYFGSILLVIKNFQFVVWNTD